MEHTLGGGIVRDVDKFATLVAHTLRGNIARILMAQGHPPTDADMAFLTREDWSLRELGEFCFDNNFNMSLDFLQGSTPEAVEPSSEETENV